MYTQTIPKIAINKYGEFIDKKMGTHILVDSH